MSPDKVIDGLNAAIPADQRQPNDEETHVSVRLDIVLAAIKAIDDARGAGLELTAGLQYVDWIRISKESEVSYETMQRAGFKRKEGWRRPYTLADARSHATTAATRLRNAWELLEPMSAASQQEARRTALGNCQTALGVAIGHLQAVLNKARTFAEQQNADTAARDWLTSIGSEPN